MAKAALLVILLYTVANGRRHSCVCTWPCHLVSLSRQLCNDRQSPEVLKDMLDWHNSCFVYCFHGYDACLWLCLCLRLLLIWMIWISKNNFRSVCCYYHVEMLNRVCRFSNICWCSCVKVEPTASILDIKSMFHKSRKKKSDIVLCAPSHPTLEGWRTWL